MKKSERIEQLEKEVAELKDKLNIQDKPLLTIEEECRPNYDEGFMLNTKCIVFEVGDCFDCSRVESYPTEREALQAKNLQLLRQLWRNNGGDNKGCYYVILGQNTGFVKGYCVQDNFHNPSIFNFKTESERDIFWNKAEALGLLDNELYKI